MAIPFRLRKTRATYQRPVSQRAAPVETASHPSDSFQPPSSKVFKRTWRYWRAR